MPKSLPNKANPKILNSVTALVALVNAVLLNELDQVINDKTVIINKIAKTVTNGQTSLTFLELFSGTNSFVSSFFESFQKTS